MNKIVLSFLISLLVSLQYALWIGDKNVIDLKRLQSAVDKTKQKNAELDQRNQKLLAEVIDLKQGGETIETLARSELGLIKEGETFYQIVE